MKKLIAFALTTLLTLSSLFTESYNQLVEKAKSYESKKEWAYALGAWYDAAKTAYENGETEATVEIFEKYQDLKTLIESGNPGIGKFGVFEMHDEWKRLLMNAEKYATEYGRYAFTIGDLSRKSVDMKARTATYSATIEIADSDRYTEIIGTVRSGYNTAWNKDWNDVPNPDYWPEISVSGLNSKSNLVNGVAIYRTSIVERGHTNINIVYAYAMSGLQPPKKINIMESAVGKKYQTAIYNAFACTRGGGAEFTLNGLQCFVMSTLYDLKFDIIDENGAELVKPKRKLIDYGLGFSYYNKDLGIYQDEYTTSNESTFDISGITESVMKKIDSGKAKINLMNAYLEYGVYNKSDDTVATTGNTRAFMKSFPELEIPIEKSETRMEEVRESVQAATKQEKFDEEQSQIDEEQTTNE